MYKSFLRLCTYALACLTLSTSGLISEIESSELLPKCVAALHFRAAVKKHDVVKLTWNPFAIPSNTVLKLYRNKKHLKTFSPTHHLHYHDRDLKEGRTYHYKLVALQAGVVTNSASKKVHVSKQVKRKLNLTASVFERAIDSTVQLAWNPTRSVHAKKFKLYRGKKELHTFEAKGPFHFKDKYRGKDQNYHYRLVAIGSNGEKILSQKLLVSTASCENCTPPTSRTIPNPATYGLGETIPPYNVSIFFTSTSTLAYSATGLPTGLGINPVTGIITGIPSQSGTFSVTVTGTSSCGSTSQTFTVVVQVT